MLDEVHVISTQPADNPLPAVHSPRAQRTFQELRTHARQALSLAEQLVNQAPRYRLTVFVEGEGTARPVEPGPYPAGTIVHIEVEESEEGWCFDSFQPPLQEDNTGPFVVITDDTTVTAHFEECMYELDVVAATQHGSKVKVSSGGKPATPGGTFPRNAVVNLQATPNTAHEYFDGWYENGALLGNERTLTLTMTAGRQIEARFLANNATLTVSLGDADRTGYIVVNPGGDIVAGSSAEEFKLPQGGEVMLVAAAAQGYTFSRWVLQVGSDKPREENDIVLTLPLAQDTKVEAFFAPIGSSPAAKQAK
jgi:hypothetical protein